MKIHSVCKEQIIVDGKYLSPTRSQKIINHSPDGFSWGYRGSGPSQLSLAIVVEAIEKMMNEKRLAFDHQIVERDVEEYYIVKIGAVGEIAIDNVMQKRKPTDAYVAEKLAARLYQDFKDEFVSRWPMDADFTIDIDMEKWIMARLGNRVMASDGRLLIM